MIFLPILFLSAGFFTRVTINTIPTGGREADSFCTPPENIAPCTCFRHPVSDRITARCANFTDAAEIKSIFDKNPGWDLQDLFIEDSTMSYLPANMLEEVYFDGLNITSTYLVTLFDRPPIRTQGLDLYLTDVKLMRGFEWESIKTVNLSSLVIVNTTVKSFGQEFKDNIPKGVQSILLENNGINSIKNEALSDLPNCQHLALRRGNLKKLSRDMFPKPSVVFYFDLSFQKIADLPEDFFVDMPKLSLFYIEGNYLTTISEKVFILHDVLYIFAGNSIECNCNIKWIPEKLKPENLIGECSEPESLKGTQLASLTAANFRYCH